MSRRSAALTFEFRICDDFSLTLSNSVKNEETFKTKTKKENLKKSASFLIVRARSASARVLIIVLYIVTM